MSILNDPEPEKPTAENDNPLVAPVLEGPTEVTPALTVDDSPLEKNASAETASTVNVSTPTPAEDSSTASPGEPESEFDKITKILMSSIGEIGEASYLKMLIYGPPGSTKSSLLGTVPNNLIADLEDGLIAIKGSKVHTGRDMAPNVKSYPYKDFQKFDKMVELLGQGYLPEFEVLSVDSISDLHKREIQDITERGHSARPSKSLYKPETDDYTEVNEKLSRFVRSMRGLERHLILTGHSQDTEIKNKAGLKETKTYLDFSLKLTNKVMAMMDLVGYLEMREFQLEDGSKKQFPVLRVISDGTIYAKTRFPILDTNGNPMAEIINPTWDILYGAWNNSRSAGTLSDLDEANALANELMQ